jgi:hypothetical protein
MARELMERSMAGEGGQASEMQVMNYGSCCCFSKAAVTLAVCFADDE